MREWRRLKRYVSSTESIAALAYNKLYERLLDHHSDRKTDTHYYKTLLLAAIVGCIAMDTSICERGFSLMNLLKTGRRRVARGWAMSCCAS